MSWTIESLTADLARICSDVYAVGVGMSIKPSFKHNGKVKFRLGLSKHFKASQILYMFTFDAGPLGNNFPVPAFSESLVENVINDELQCTRSLLLFPCKNHSLKYSGLTKQQRHSLYQV